MQIDRILYPVKSLGPGNRVAIWTIGCRKRCFNCASPELQKFNNKKNVTLEQFQSMLLCIKDNIDGFTITGGEPLCQAEELSLFLDEMRKIAEDILIFTGFSEKEIDVMKNYEIQECITKAAVVISGEYIDVLNDNKTALVASSNQKIIWNNENYKKKYYSYMKNGRIIENFYYGDNLISVGIHSRRELT